jgi:hypothetical protein
VKKAGEEKNNVKKLNSERKRGSNLERPSERN